MRSIKIVLSLLFLIINLAVIESYTFLGVFPLPYYSHYTVGRILMEALVQSGHKVFVISQAKLKIPIVNYHEILLESLENLQNALIVEKIIREQNPFLYMFDFRIEEVFVTDRILSDPNVKKLLRSNHTFDAVICDLFATEALVGLSEHFSAPLIVLGTLGTMTMETDIVGSVSPPSYVPYVTKSYTDHMSFIERCANIWDIVWDEFHMNFIYYPRQAALYKKHFPNLKRDMYTVRNNAAIVFVNSHVSLGFSRPYAPNQIDIAGMHVGVEDSILPKQLEEFIKDAKHGVIYFSMGTIYHNRYMPKHKTRKLLTAFKGLKERVLWSNDDSVQQGQIDNIYISEWFPQHSILAHKNVKVFITHAGFLSMAESIYYGKPVVCLPLFGDQFTNAIKAETHGIGIKLDYYSLKIKDLIAAVQHVINNKNYTQRVQEMSVKFRDQPIPPLNLAVYWVEYVARHKGAKHLRSASLDLNLIAYHNIDAIFVLFCYFIFILYVIVTIFHLSYMLILTIIDRVRAQRQRQN